MRLLPVLLVCAVVPGAAGCGAEKHVTNVVEPVAQAAAKTAAAGTAQLAISGSTSVAGRTARFNGTGVFDMRSKRGAFHQVVDVPGKGSIRLDELTAKFVLYLRSPQLTANLPGGKHWLKLDLQALGRQQGIDISQLQQIGAGADPTQWLSYLEKSGSVTKLGAVSIRGVATTHYRALVDLDKVAASAGKAAPSVVRIEQLMGSHRLPVEIWIDSQGRVRRLALSYDITQPAPAHTQFAVDFVRFGVSADVQLPHAKDTVDLSRLTGH